MADAETNRAILRAIYDHFAAGDVDGMAQYMREDAVIIEADSLPYGGVYRGPEGLKQLLGKISEIWEDVSLDIQDILASDHAAAGYGELRMTVPHTGERIRFQICEVWQFEDGKITRCEPMYFDTARCIAALNACEAR